MTANIPPDVDPELEAFFGVPLPEPPVATREELEAFFAGPDPVAPPKPIVIPTPLATPEELEAFFGPDLPVTCEP